MALRDVDYAPVHIHVHQCRTRVLVPSRDYKAGWNYTLVRVCVRECTRRGAASRFLSGGRGERWAMTLDPRANWTGPRGFSRSITPDIRRAAVTIRQLTGSLFTDSWNLVIRYTLPIHALLLPFAGNGFVFCFVPGKDLVAVSAFRPVELKERWDREGERGGRRRPEKELVISGGVGYWWNYGGFICILICVL